MIFRLSLSQISVDYNTIFQKFQTVEIKVYIKPKNSFLFLKISFISELFFGDSKVYFYRSEQLSV